MYPGDIERGAQLLREGRLVAFPTETVYGLGANALDPVAVARIFEAKGRPATSPVIVHVASIASARALAAVWPDAAQQLAERFWPGPLTLVLTKQPCIPGIVTAGLPNVGLRMPAHPIALELIERAQLPVAAPSANRFTQLSPTSADHVRRSLGTAVDYILDGGSTPVGIESTVLSLAGTTPLLLRPGMISREEIESVTGPVDLVGTVSGSHPAPGMHARHYSPATPLYLSGYPATAPQGGRGLSLSLLDFGEDPKAVAANLYARLHQADQQGYDWILVETPPARPEWAAIADRLHRAAAKITRSS